MRLRIPIISSIREMVLISGFAVGFTLISGLATAAEHIDPEADKVLRSMSAYMDELSAFSSAIDVDNEIIDTTGRKLQLSASTNLVVKRPEKLYAHRRGPAVPDVEFIFDGKVLTVHGKGLNVYAQFESPGTIEDAVSKVRTETGLDALAGDLLYADSHTGLMEGVVSGDYMGTAFVNGVECHHLAFRQPKVDWQLWVQAGDTGRSCGLRLGRAGPAASPDAVPSI